MRLFLVFLFLYLIPIVTLFVNYKNFKRACIYGSIYTVLITSIAISNSYMSAVNDIEAIYYKNNVLNNTYRDNNEDFENIKEEIYDKEVSNVEIYEEDIKEDELEVYNLKTYETEDAKELFKENDLNAINEFKEEIYEIELIALKPMRECIPYTKDIKRSLKQIQNIRDSIYYSISKCDEVIGIYENMEIPELFDEEAEKSLVIAKDDVISCYEVRKRAMEEALNLVDKKNPKYITKITEYLELSDEHILNYKERIDETYKKIENK